MLFLQLLSMMGNMAQNVQKTIDIEKVLRSKMGSKVKYVPRFVISWLKRLAHEDEVNAFLWENRDKEGTPWLEACVKYLDMDVSIEGEENLPDKHDGKLYTFVYRHQ